MKDVLPEVDAWRSAGNQVAIATVVKVEGSAPRPVGATMAVSSAGDLAGSVSGGGNGHGRPNRTRCGAFDSDDGGDRHLVAGGTPGIDIRQNVFHRSISFLDWPRSPHAARTWDVSSINGSG